MAAKATKKNKKLGRGKEKTVEITFIPGAVIVDNYEAAQEALEMMEAAAEQIADVNHFIAEARKQVTEWVRTTDTSVIQMEGHYWRKIAGTTRFWVGVPEEMPTPKPKGAKSLKEIVADMKTPDGKSLWNFITKRVPDKRKIDLAVKRGYITQKAIDKAYLEKDIAPYIKAFDGEALDGDDD